MAKLTGWPQFLEDAYENAFSHTVACERNGPQSECCFGETRKSYRL